MQIQEKIFRKNKEISPFYNKLSTNFVPNLKIYPYLKNKKKRKEKRQAELLDETEIFPRGSGWYNPSIVEKSAPTLGKQRTTKCSVDEGIKRKINIPSRDKLGDGIRVKSSPTPPTSKSFVIRSIENALRRWTDARILAPDFLISLSSALRDSCAAAIIVFPIGETSRLSSSRSSERIIFRINSLKKKRKKLIRCLFTMID